MSVEMNGNISSSDDESQLPCIEILEQPKQRGYRFRYGCEGKTAGCIPGESSTPAKKSVPSIKLKNIPAGCNTVVVISCVTTEDNRPHPHKLVGKNCEKGVCTLNVKRTSTVVLQNIGIQCVKKKTIQESLLQREQIKVNPFNRPYYEEGCQYDMKKVRLAIQAFIQDSRTGQHFPIPPVITNEIYDHKSENELVICRMDKTSSQAKGGEEVFLLCEKVNKDDIQVQFSDMNGWESWGDFAPNDVHKQFAIVFKTPPYKDLKIREPRTVQIRLCRQSDESYSEPKDFTYMPTYLDPFGLSPKRRRKMPKYTLPTPQPTVPNLDVFQGSPGPSSSSGGKGGGGQIPKGVLEKLRIQNSQVQQLTRAGQTQMVSPKPEPGTSKATCARQSSDGGSASTSQELALNIQYPTLEEGAGLGVNTPSFQDLMPQSSHSTTGTSFRSPRQMEVPSVVNQLGNPMANHQGAPVPTVLPGNISEPVMATEDSDPQQLFNSMTATDSEYFSPGVLDSHTYNLDNVEIPQTFNDEDLLQYLEQGQGILEADNGGFAISNGVPMEYLSQGQGVLEADNGGLVVSVNMVNAPARNNGNNLGVKETDSEGFAIPKGPPPKNKRQKSRQKKT